jgi:hypothetical protein
MSNLRLQSSTHLYYSFEKLQTFTTFVRIKPKISIQTCTTPKNEPKPVRRNPLRQVTIQNRTKKFQRRETYIQPKKQQTKETFVIKTPPKQAPSIENPVFVHFFKKSSEVLKEELLC